MLFQKLIKVRQLASKLQLWNMVLQKYPVGQYPAVFPGFQAI